MFLFESNLMSRDEKKKKRLNAQYLQVQWIEEKNNIFAFVLFKTDFFELSVYHSSTGKIWGWLVNGWHFCNLLEAV